MLFVLTIAFLHFFYLYLEKRTGFMFFCFINLGSTKDTLPEKIINEGIANGKLCISRNI